MQKGISISEFENLQDDKSYHYQYLGAGMILPGHLLRALLLNNENWNLSLVYWGGVY